MRVLKLTEYRTTAAIPLTASERDELRRLVPSLTITPSTGRDDAYDLAPAATVGIVRVGDLQVELQPRLPVKQVLFLVSYALDPRNWHDYTTAMAPDAHLVEALVPTFAHHVRKALRRGLLHGYRHVNDTLTTIRGRIRFADQLRARPGRHLPIEVAFDEFTPDITENRLLLAALERLLRVPLRHEETRRALFRLREQFATVTHVPYASSDVPKPSWTRLNQHYQPAVMIARLVLQGSVLEVTTGPVTGTGVLFDMAKVFEYFVVTALREALGADAQTFPQGAARRRVYLDDENVIALYPDLSWWRAGRCVFVGDCKYKRAAISGVPNADLYQLLAYTTSLNLREGLLVYAAGEYPPRTHTVSHAGKRLHVLTCDLAGTPDDVLAQIDSVAEEIRREADLSTSATLIGTSP
jgi:5-methylcytosine-specific restriction enzyme subunit McrC